MNNQLHNKIVAKLLAEGINSQSFTLFAAMLVLDKCVSAKLLISHLNLYTKEVERDLAKAERQEIILRLIASCNEAISGECDKSDDGFFAMIKDLEKLQNLNA